jgi:hypothetical protein
MKYGSCLIHQGFRLPCLLNCDELDRIELLDWLALSSGIKKITVAVKHSKSLNLVAESLTLDA